MKRYAEQMKRSLSQLLDDQGVSVVEIILILVENSTTQNPCG